MPSPGVRPTAAASRGVRASTGLRKGDRAGGRGNSRSRSRLAEDQEGAVVVSAGDAKTGGAGARMEWGCSAESR